MLQVLASGLALGSLYGLMALGLVLILKSTDIANFAQGEMALVSTYVAFFIMSRYGANFWLALLAAMAFAVLLALIVERLTIRPILGAGALAAVFMTFGLNITLNSFTALFFGPAEQRMPTPWPSTPLRLGDVVVSWTSVAALLVGFAGMLLLRAFFRYTAVGVQMRAVAESLTVPPLLGISVPRVFALSWAIAGVFGVLAGVVLAQATDLDPLLMGAFILKAFTGPAIGGFVSFEGAFFGGLLLGALENLVAVYISTTLKDGIAFMIIILVLLIRPTGLFATAAQRQV